MIVEQKTAWDAAGLQAAAVFDPAAAAGVGPAVAGVGLALP